MAVTAFAHDHSEPQHQRRLDVDSLKLP